MAGKLRAAILVCSLKSEEAESSTMRLCRDVAARLGALGVSSKLSFMSRADLRPGTTRKVGDDGGPVLYRLIENSDILIIGTPIWWGNPSSLAQRVIERMDEFDEYYVKGGKNRLYGKVFGAVVTGTEDGVQACAARLFGWAVHLGFTVPPEALAYWLNAKPYRGEPEAAGRPREKSDDYTPKMAANLVACATMLSGIETPKGEPHTWK